MMLRLKCVIAHSQNTKLPGEDGEDTTTGWGTKPSPKVKPFREKPRDTPTRGWGNRPNPGKDPTSTSGWGNRPYLKKNFAGIKVQGQHNN